jgi:hypothetical protein
MGSLWEAGRGVAAAPTEEARPAMAGLGRGVATKEPAAAAIAAEAPGSPSGAAAEDGGVLSWLGLGGV